MNDSLKNPPISLTIAGFDSGGAAGLLADTKTFQSHGVYTIAALTAITAQNSTHLTKIRFTTKDFLREQLHLILSDYGCNAVKTGFIGKPIFLPIIRKAVESFNLKNVIVDPVLVNHKGESMFSKALLTAYKRHLFPVALCITPNIYEAELLTGMKIQTLDSLVTAAKKLHESGASHVLIKRFRQKNTVIDLLYDGKKSTYFRSKFIDSNNIHGSGDTLSAAITANCAKGIPLRMAVQKAHQYTQNAIKNAQGWEISHGHGPINHFNL